MELHSTIKPESTQPFTLSVFLPFYNEEQNIRAAIEGVIAAVSAMPRVSAFEVIAVNDGSSDNTLGLAQELAQKYPQVKVVNHEKNQGYGSALVSGFHAAQYEYVFFTDGDLQFDVSEISKLTKFIPEYEVVLGYRAPRRDPFMRLANAWAWNKLNRFGFGLRVRDIDCAFKLFRRERVANVPFVSRGAMLSAEMLIRLKREGVIFMEVPVTHLPRPAGSPTGAKLSVIFRAFREFFSIYLNTDLGNKTYLQVAQFAMVGILNTIVDVAVYYALTRGSAYFLDHVLLARVISFLVGSACSFFVNRAWTFEKQGVVRTREVARFYTMTAASVFIGTLAMQIGIKVFGLYDLYALLISIICTFVWNFTISKQWVFNVRRKPVARVSEQAAR